MSCVTSMQSSAKSSGRAEVSCGRAACSKSRNQMLLVLGPANFSPAKQIGQHSHHSPYLALHFRCSESRTFSIPAACGVLDMSDAESQGTP